MSKVEEGNLFFKRFGRTALALSMVTSSFIFADQSIVADANSTEYLENGEDNSSVAAGINGDGAVNQNANLAGAIIAGRTLRIQLFLTQTLPIPIVMEMTPLVKPLV